MKTQNKSDSAQPAAPGKPVRKRAAPKASPTRDKRDKPNKNEERSYPPEVLADLAVKLVQLTMDASPTSARPRPQLAARAFDAVFADALKRAEMLLLTASGQSDEDVQAYQLFTEEDGLMSFEGIAERFNDFQWEGMKSQNTVKPIITDLVIAAEFEVRKAQDRLERLVAVRSGYPGGVYHLVGRVKRHIRSMINRTRLLDLFDDPAKAADLMGQYFIRLMERNIPEDWVGNPPEDMIAADGHGSFIKYVCGGLSYESFIGDPPRVWMDLERLGSLVFFLKNLEQKDPTDLKKTASDLSALMRLINGSDDVTPEVVKDLDACLKELRKPDADIAHARKCAGKAGRSLRAMQERWYLIQLAGLLDLGNLIAQFGRWKNSLTSGDQSLTDRVEQVLQLLRRARDVGETSEQPMDGTEIRDLLNALWQVLQEANLREAAEVWSTRFGESIADVWKRVADRLKDGLKERQPAKRHARDSLNGLLQELEPYSGQRRCRPYELFLFAAQKCLWQDKLVSKRNALKPNFIPYPPYPLTTPILESHRGAYIAAGIGDAD